jgi:hypothetical protein
MLEHRKFHPYTVVATLERLIKITTLRMASLDFLNNEIIIGLFTPFFLLDRTLEMVHGQGDGLHCAKLTENGILRLINIFVVDSSQPRVACSIICSCHK